MFKGRHRIIYDRLSNEPYLERYYLLFKNRKWFPFNIFVHKILKSDLDDLHDHPWPYFTLILKGGYWEHTLDGKFWRSPGHFRVASSDSFHRLEVKQNVKCWTLFIVGPKVREWGFLKEGTTWQRWDDYLEEKRQNT